MPLWDDNPLMLPKLRLVTWGLIVANVLVYIFTASTPPEMLPAIMNFALTPANVTGVPINATPVAPDLTLVTYMFLHANFWHLLGNMIFLWVFGDDVGGGHGPAALHRLFMSAAASWRVWRSPPARRIRNRRWSALRAP